VSQMTREVLAFVRGERQLLVRPVFLGTFWRDLGANLAKELEERRIALELVVEYGGAARFDEGKIRRLATNLARNAAQAMPVGGHFRLACRADGDALVLAFEDDGPGIPPHVATRLFTAFNSHGKKGGTGLGLAIVKEVVDAHGGSIECRTAAGEGTTFTVRLPGAISP
jgi:signal transduction histidine kinase